MQATARMASVVSSTLPARRRLIRSVVQETMNIKNTIATISILALCVAAAPTKPHPLQLVLPAPGEALRLAEYKTYPDELVVDKVRSLERVARDANPKAEPWSIYLTPNASTIPIKGWEADLNRPDTPLPEATLGQCIEWLCRRVPTLQYEVVEGRILIDVKKQKSEAQQDATSNGG
jgi:hypothetical protein